MANKIQQISNDHKAYLRKRQLPSIVLQLTDESKIIDAINNRNDKKSHGYIDISVVMIKEAKYIVAAFSTRAFNFSIINGIYPIILKIAQVIPLHKASSKKQLSN